jgi:hypothetical protein
MLRADYNREKFATITIVVSYLKLQILKYLMYLTYNVASCSWNYKRL